MDALIDGQEHTCIRKRNSEGKGANKSRYFFRLIIYFFGYCAEEEQINIIGVRVGERGICILTTGSNQSSSSF
jgi:hypothetical protein